MPELPEVETTKRGLIPHLLQQNISNVIIHKATLRYPINDDLVSRIQHSTVNNLTRRAKYLIWHLQDLQNVSTGFLLCHLGMSGSMRVMSQHDQIKKHDHVEIFLQNQKKIVYHDPRRFGFILWYENLNQIKFMQKLGPEPLSDEFDAEYLYHKSKNKALAIKQFIMNQEIVVGVGNIYASEALFMAKISPKRKANNISKKRYLYLVECIKNVLIDAINQGGTTLRDFVSAEGSPGYFSQTLNVYGRENQPCKDCAKPIKRIVQQQRASYYCANCQH